MSTSKTWPGGATGATPTAYSIPDPGDLNWGTSLTAFLKALADGAQSTTSQKGAVRKAVTSPITVSTEDYYINSNLTVAGAVAVTLPAGANKQIFYIVDGKGDATTNNITITPDGSETIDGSATFVISANGEGVGLIYNEADTDWKILARWNQAGSSVGGFTADKVIISDGSGNLSAATTSTTQVQYLASATGTTGTASTNIVFSTSPVLTTPNIGTPSAGVLTNCTGLVLTSGVTGVLPVANGGTNSSTALNSNRMMISSGGAVVEQSAITAARTLVSDVSGLPVASSTTTTQVEYLSAATGTTGTTSTNLVFSTSPVLTTPNIGTPSAGVLTNCTGLVLTSGVTGTLPVANGGTGVTTSTGTGSVVLSSTPTITTPVLASYADVTTSGATNPYIVFTSNTSNVGGYVYYQHSTDVMAMRHDSGNDNDFTINASSQIGIGTNAPRTAYYGTSITQKMTVEEATNQYLAGFITNVNTTAGAEIVLGKSRGAALQSNTIVQNGDTLGRILFEGADGSNMQAAAEIQCVVDGTPGASDMPGLLSFRTSADGSVSPTERMVITEDGAVGIGINPPTAQLHLANEDVNDNTTIKIDNDVRSWSLACRGDTNDIFAIIDNTAASFRCAVDTSGVFMNGKATSAFATPGIELRGASGMWVTSETDSAIHRQTTDGNLLSFWHASSQEGVISVSGTTVTYGSFCGSHWSQLADNSKDPTILRGTVMESINEKCVWEGEANDQLAKCKVSDTEESKAVYGVFFGWDEQSEEADEDDNPNTRVPNLKPKANVKKVKKEDIRAKYRGSNDMFVAAIGAFVVRVRKGETLEIGDYLQSAGDGTAKKQADDLMRSSTIAKVTCTEKVETYPDGSFLVSCTLHCG